MNGMARHWRASERGSEGTRGWVSGRANARAYEWAGERCAGVWRVGALSGSSVWVGTAGANEMQTAQEWRLAWNAPGRGSPPSAASRLVAMPGAAAAGTLGTAAVEVCEACGVLVGGSWSGGGRGRGRRSGGVGVGVGGAAGGLTGVQRPLAHGCSTILGHDFLRGCNGAILFEWLFGELCANHSPLLNLSRTICSGAMLASWLSVPSLCARRCPPVRVEVRRRKAPLQLLQDIHAVHGGGWAARGLRPTVGTTPLSFHSPRSTGGG